MYDFEASANHVVRFEPDSPNGSVCHTNHPLVNDDVKSWYGAHDPSLRDDQRPKPGDSHIRLEAVEKRMVAKGTIDNETIKATLQSEDDEQHPVCRTNLGKNPGFTFAPVIMTLSNRPTLQIVAGPPDEVGYSTHFFK